MLNGQLIAKYRFGFNMGPLQSQRLFGAHLEIRLQLLSLLVHTEVNDDALSTDPNQL